MGKKYKSETTPIYFNDVPEDVVKLKKPIYPSLTAMMQDLAEKLENKKIY